MFTNFGEKKLQNYGHSARKTGGELSASKAYILIKAPD